MTLRPIFLAVILAIAAITLKLINFELPQNFGAFGALAIFCGCFLRGPLSILLPVGSMVLSDVIGHFLNDSKLGMYAPAAMFCNYLGLASMCCVGLMLRIRKSLPYIFCGTLIGTALFFTISNFGCWLDPRMGYPSSYDGLLTCYIAGIPFVRGSLASDMLFTLTVFAFYAWCQDYMLELATQKSVVETRPNNQAE